MSAGGSDAFVTKLNASGSAILFSTFLGGTAADNGTGVALDSAGSIYVTGSTGSSSFTGVGPGSLQPTNTTTSFLTKLTAAGAVVYSMFLGGTDVAVDGAGAAYITGGTNNPSFPGVGPGSIQPTFASIGSPPATDAFVTKINPAGSAIVYSTYLGAADLDSGSGIAVDSSGAAYVLGITRSTTGLPGIGPGSLQGTYGGGATDAFVAKVNPAGTALVYSSYLGGTGTEVPGNGGPVAVDGQGRMFVTGITNSASTFPGGAGATILPANGGNSGTFVTELAPSGTSVAFTAVLGGTAGGNNPGAIDLNPAGNPYVTGATMSANFTGVGAGSLQPTKGAGQDGFVAKIVAATQAISFTSTPPSPAAVGGSYPLAATGGASGNPVVFSVDAASTPGACSLAGSTIHLDHVGTCVVDANQDGTADYPPAPQAQQTFTIVKGTPVLTWPQPAQIAFGTPLGAAQLDPTASVPGTFAFDPPAGTVLQPGMHTLSATFTPASPADYNGASVSTQLVVGFTGPCLASPHTGPLKVTSGQSLCVTGLVTGPITVQPGGALWASGATITGPVTADGAAAVTVCGSTLTGPLTITGTVGPVVVGDPPGCAGQPPHRPDPPHAQPRRRQLRRKPRDRPGDGHEQQRRHRRARQHRHGAGHGRRQQLRDLPRDRRRDHVQLLGRRLRCPQRAAGGDPRELHRRRRAGRDVHEPRHRPAPWRRRRAGNGDASADPWRGAPGGRRGQRRKRESDELDWRDEQRPLRRQRRRGRLRRLGQRRRRRHGRLQSVQRRQRLRRRRLVRREAARRGVCRARLRPRDAGRRRRRRRRRRRQRRSRQRARRERRRGRRRLGRRRRERRRRESRPRRHRSHAGRGRHRRPQRVERAQRRQRHRRSGRLAAATATAPAARPEAAEAAAGSAAAVRAAAAPAAARAAARTAAAAAPEAEAAVAAATSLPPRSPGR